MAGTTLASPASGLGGFELRLMVLDGSRTLHSIVRRLAPRGVEVESAASFDEATLRLRRDPPGALIVNLSPAKLPWGELKLLCQQYSPPIPVLYESCIYETPADAGIGDLDDSGSFLTKPYSLEELRTQIERLVRLARTRPSAG